MDFPDFHLGSESECIKISLLNSLSIEGWAQAKVEISAHCFYGVIKPYFEVSDFDRFYNELKILHQTLIGRAELRPVEQQFRFAIVGNGRGQMSVSGEAWEHATYGSRLDFTFELDQTFLAAPLIQLEHILGSVDISVHRSQISAETKRIKPM